MGHINFDKGQRKRKGLYGFYLALAICLAAVGGVAVLTFISSMPDIDIENSGQSQSSVITTKTKEVGQIVTNVPDERTTTTGTSTQSQPTQTTASKAADLFILPLTNEVIRIYSGVKPVFNETMQDWRVHNGVDFKGTAGQSVKALADGTIESISKDPLWGDIVIIDHGYGIKSRYCGVRVSTHKEKSTVKVGDVIGTLSTIPCEASDGPHLHLEIIANGEYVNPIDAIGREVKYSTTTTTATTTATKAN
ncbi:MAG: M23 family metallopeptidase [Oscillospiraceae bacterium]|nr:M23 family metallopeptidase [Oscillospiraceae bacterium]